MNFGVLISEDSPKWTWIQRLPTTQLLGGIVTKKKKTHMIVFPRAMSHDGVGMGTGSSLWLES